MSTNRLFECPSCARRWWARFIPRSSASPGEWYPAWCMRCDGDEGEPIHITDDGERAA